MRGEILAGGICQLTTPSLWRFLSPGNGGIEGGVKTIEGWEGSSGGKAGMGLYHLSFSTPLACARLRDASYMSPNWLLITLQRYEEKQLVVQN